MNLMIIIGDESYKAYDELLEKHKKDLYVIGNEDIYIARQKILNCKQTQIVISFDTILGHNKKYITEIIDNISDKKTLYIMSSCTDKMLTRISKKYSTLTRYDGVDKNPFYIFKLLTEPANSTNLQRFMSVDLRTFLYWANNTHCFSLKNANVKEIVDKVSIYMEKSAVTDKFLKSYIYYNFPRGLNTKINVKWRKKQKTEINNDILNNIMREYKCTRSNAIKTYKNYTDIKQYNKSFHIDSFEGSCIKKCKSDMTEKDTQKKVKVKKETITENKVLGTLDKW